VVAELKDDEIREYTISPEDLGLASRSLLGLDVSDSDASLALIGNAFSKRSNEAADKAADMVALNAGAALYVAGVSSSLKQGVALAQDVIASGQALEKMRELASFSQEMS
jgi:anthranilate phosphoribosyltransferase